jgi:hypothetical protein
MKKHLSKERYNRVQQKFNLPSRRNMRPLHVSILRTKYKNEFMFFFCIYSMKIFIEYFIAYAYSLILAIFQN